MNRSRRNFLIASAVLITGFSAYQKRQLLTAFLPRNKARSNVLSFIRHRSHAAVVGAVYITLNPQTSSEEALMSTLSEYLLIDLSTASKDDIEKIILSTIKEDYKRGQTVTLDGWILSRTEGVLAGLVAVTHYKLKT